MFEPRHLGSYDDSRCFQTGSWLWYDRIRLCGRVRLTGWQDASLPGGPEAHHYQTSTGPLGTGMACRFAAPGSSMNEATIGAGS